MFVLILSLKGISRTPDNLEGSHIWRVIVSLSGDYRTPLNDLEWAAFLSQLYYLGKGKPTLGQYRLFKGWMVWTKYASCMEEFLDPLSECEVYFTSVEDVIFLVQMTQNMLWIKLTVLRKKVKCCQPTVNFNCLKTLKTADWGWAINGLSFCIYCVTVDMNCYSK